MRAFENLDLHSKRVLLRLDLNVPVNGTHIEDNARIVRTTPTIQLLKSKGAKIILASHFGRPDGKIATEFSLRQLVPELENIYQTKVHFAPSIDDAVALSRQVGNGEIMLLENLRFYSEEETNDLEFAKLLSRLGNIYINDAFSCSHRTHASIVAITQFLPAYPGLLMKEEVKNLESLLAQDTKPLMAIIGGRKVSTKLKVLSFMDGLCDYLVVCGAMANTMLKAYGYEVHSSFYEPSLVMQAKSFLTTAKSKVLLPLDVIVALKTDMGFTDVHTCAVNNIPQGYCILDAGPASCQEIITSLRQCKAVLWNGPLGMFEDARFRVATDMVAHEIAALTLARQIKSIAGGGDTVSALRYNGLSANFSYISTAGGAFLEWLEGGTLPGIEALKKNIASYDII